MKLGVLILCHNDEKLIRVQTIIRKYSELNGLEICLVNNHSSDGTYQKLLDINEFCENIFLININKHKSEQAALRAGSRFMFSQSRVARLGYVTGLGEVQLDRIIQGLVDNLDAIRATGQELKLDNHNRVTKCQELFEIPIQMLIPCPDQQPAQAV